jgi:phosphoenolpyruvate carboxykinase (ATP)
VCCACTDPLHHIPNYVESGAGQHPKACIFLTCDAFGVLPPVARLSTGQAMYHFISGFTAKVAGTERGVTEPTPTFSACFGAAFLPLHPSVYAELLDQKLSTHGTVPYLVNTGWAGGPAQNADGTDRPRMSIKDTRGCINAILDGSIETAEFTTCPYFGFEIPKVLPGIDASVLNPSQAWEDKDEYDRVSKKLAVMFAHNFMKYDTDGSIAAHGPTCLPADWKDHEVDLGDEIGG